MGILSTGVRTFTTFEVARICGVFHTTVINWANKGKLKVHHTPGGHRRIDSRDLVEFMRRYDMPIPDDLLHAEKRVLIVEDDPAVQRMLTRALEGLPRVELQACVSGLDALIAVGRRAPDLIVLDVGIPQVNGLDVCKVLHSNEHTKQIPIIAISGQMLGADEMRFLRTHADKVFRKPLSTTQLREAVCELLMIEAPAAGKRV